MITGGIRRQSVAQLVVNSGVQLVGMATALAIEPNLPKAWQSGKDPVPAISTITRSNKSAAAMALQAKVKYQLHCLAKGRETNAAVSPLGALLCDQVKTLRKTAQYRRWIRKQ